MKNYVESQSKRERNCMIPLDIRDVFEGVADWMSEVIRWVDTPIVACAVVGCELDAECNRVDFAVLEKTVINKPGTGNEVEDLRGLVTKRDL